MRYGISHITSAWCWQLLNPGISEKTKRVPKSKYLHVQCNLLWQLVWKLLMCLGKYRMMLTLDVLRHRFSKLYTSRFVQSLLEQPKIVWTNSEVLALLQHTLTLWQKAACLDLCERFLSCLTAAEDLSRFSGAVCSHHASASLQFCRCRGRKHTYVLFI